MTKAITVKLPLPEELSRKVQRRLMRRCAAAVRKAAKARLPVGTTRALSKSLFSSVSRQGTGVVGAKAPHARLVHQGTRPHVIKAKKAGGLAFTAAVGMRLPTGTRGPKALYRAAGGRLTTVKRKSVATVRKSVHHPGAKPQPFLTDALAASRGTIDGLIRSEGEQVLQEALT